MGGSEFQTNASVTHKQYAPAKPVNKQAAEQQSAVSNIALKESPTTGLKWNKDNEINNKLTHEDTVLLSNPALNADAVDNPSRSKPVTRTTDLEMGGLLTKYKEALKAGYEAGHNLLAPMISVLKSTAHKVLAELRGATPEDIKKIQHAARKESCEGLAVGWKNFSHTKAWQDILPG